MNIITKNLDEQIPVYCQYQGQHNLQPAYIELDCRGDGELMADYSGDIGNAVPSYYWHGLAVRWHIDPATSGESLLNLFANQEFLDVCQRILDGFEEVWDGNNFVGRYNEDADEAVEEAKTIINNELETCEVWDVNEWLFRSASLKESWSDQSLSEAVAECESYVEYNQVVDGDIEDALIGKAKELLDDERWDRLTETHIKTLIERGMATEHDLETWREEVTA